ncbi:MAG: hypothetical protein U1F15_01960 [Burkholderiales bacterium]
MVTKTFDIELPPELAKFTQKPICIPLPKPSTVKLNLPMGGTLQGITDVTKAIPDDCSLSFSLALQLMPFMASLDCLFKIVKVIEPLVKVVTALGKPDPIEAAKALPALADAVKPLLECIAKFVGLGVPLFIRDLLRLIAKLLRCITQQLKSILNVMGGLALQITSAQSAGNADLLATLQCAQENAQTAAAHSMSALEPIMLILSMAEPFMGIAGVDPIKMPQIGSDSDLAALQSTVDTLDELAKTLSTIADGLG